jgi:hypothetical protein
MSYSTGMDQGSGWKNVRTQPPRKCAKSVKSVKSPLRGRARNLKACSVMNDGCPISARFWQMWDSTNLGS